MKFTTSLFALALLSPAAAFAPSQKPFVSQPTTALSAEGQSRQDFLSQSAAILLTGTGIAATFDPRPANAAKYGSFGAGSPGVLDPKEVDVDLDILKSDGVQAALKKVAGYKTSVADMQAALQADPQTNVRRTIVKDLDFASLRDTLNMINTAFDEESQRGTDRLIRVIMQDITELEVANTQKEGVPRSPRRLEIMEGKLAKLDKAFADYLAFGEQ